VNSVSTASTHRARWTEWLLVILLSANLVWTTLCLGGYRPETMVVTSFLNGLILIVYLMGRLWAEKVSDIHPVSWWFLPFLIYAAANVLLVTPVQWLGWHDWLWWTQMVMVFWVVLNGIHHSITRNALLGVICTLGFVAVGMACYQRFSQPDWLMMGRTQADQFLGRSSGPFGIPNSLAALLMLIIPATWVLALRRNAPAVQRVLFGYLGISFVIGLMLTVSRGGWLAMGLALVVWPLLAVRKNWKKRIGGTIAAALLIGLVGWGLYSFNSNTRQRFDQMAVESGEWTRPIMWRGAWNLFQENPWLGSGAGSYNILFEKHRPVEYQHEPQWAHNDYLNTLSDYGAVGFILFFGAGLAVFLRCYFRRKPKVRAAAATSWDGPLFWQAVAVGVLAFAIQLVVDFHFKIPALAMVFAAVSALLIKRIWRSERSERRDLGMVGKCGLGLASLAVVTGMVWGAMPHYRSEAYRYTARQALDTLWRHDEGEPEYREKLESSLAGLRAATQINPQHAQAWADLAYATALRAHVEKGHTATLGKEAEGYALRALEITRVVPEYWIRRAVAKDMQLQWLPAGDDMVQAMRLAPASALLWYYQAHHLSLKATGLPQARAAVAYSLRLDPGNVAAQRLRQRLATKN